MPVKVYGLTNIGRKLNKVRKTLQEPEFLERVGRTAVREVKANAQKGYDKDGNLMKPLKPSTIKRRKELSKVNKTSKHYSHAISNLSFTGQLINSIKHFVRKKQVLIRPEGSRRPYTMSEEFRENKAGTKARKVKNKSKSTPTNPELMGYMRELGRDIMGVHEGLRQKIREMAVRQIQKSIRQQRNKKR